MVPCVLPAPRPPNDPLGQPHLGEALPRLGPSKRWREVEFWCAACHSCGSLLKKSTPQAGPRGAIYL